VTDVAWDERVCASIRERRLLEFDYDGKRRVTEPYCHGVSTTGKQSVRALQVGGATRPGGFGFGKMWTIGKMTNVRVSETTFAPDDPNYNPDDSAMSVIHCRIER
jgi:hypothetical protein